MKKFKLLTVLALLSAEQLYTKNENPALAFAIASQAADSFTKAIYQGNDDVSAVALLKIINDTLAQDQSLQQQLAASKNGYLFKGQPLDITKIQTAMKDLQDNRKRLDDSRDRLRKGGLTVGEKKKVNRRDNDIKDIDKQLAQYKAALQENTNAQTQADANAAAVKALIAKNMLGFEQAVESYINSFGQAYKQPGTVYGSTVIISSKYAKNMPITPREYNNLLETLQQGVKQFGDKIIIDFTIEEKPTTAKLSEVVAYIKNMPISSTSYASYAMYAVGGLAAATAAMATYNVYQGKDWNDTSMLTNAAQAITPDAAKEKVKDAAEILANIGNQINAGATNVGAQISSASAGLNSKANAVWNKMSDYGQGYLAGLSALVYGANATAQINNEQASAAIAQTSNEQASAANEQASAATAQTSNDQASAANEQASAATAQTILAPVEAQQPAQAEQNTVQYYLNRLFSGSTDISSPAAYGELGGDIAFTEDEQRAMMYTTAGMGALAATAAGASQIGAMNATAAAAQAARVQSGFGAYTTATPVSAAQYAQTAYNNVVQGVANAANAVKATTSSGIKGYQAGAQAASLIGANRYAVGVNTAVQSAALTARYSPEQAAALGGMAANAVSATTKAGQSVYQGVQSAGQAAAVGAALTAPVAGALLAPSTVSGITNSMGTQDNYAWADSIDNE